MDREISVSQETPVKTQLVANIMSLACLIGLIAAAVSVWMWLDDREGNTDQTRQEYQWNKQGGNPPKTPSPTNE
jgi:hypothetical protein